MQFEPNIVIFDTTNLTIEHPLSPEGSLYTSYLSETPSALHYHNFFEIGYSERGSGIFNVGGDPIPFHGRCCSIIYEGQSHIAQSANEDRSLWHFLYIDLNMLFAPQENHAESLLASMQFHHWQDYSFPYIMTEQEAPDCYALIVQILDEAAKMQPNALNVIRGLVFSLLHIHERYFTPLATLYGMHDTRLSLQRELESTINFINQNYREPITVERLTSIANMSKSNLQRKMIALTGYPPLGYVRMLRLRYACALLLDRKLSIAAVANEVGYNLSSFNRQFQNEFHMSPSAWLKEQRKR